MNAKSAKKQRKRQRRVLNQQIQLMFKDIDKWPLKDRIKLAWMIVRGKTMSSVPQVR